MTVLQRNAMELLQTIPEEQLPLIIQMMKELNKNAQGHERVKHSSRQAAFEELESLRRHVPDLDEERELQEWREEKFGNAHFD